MVMRFYHACPKEDTESILRLGLLRSKSSLWRASGGAIYLTREKIWRNESPDYDILRVELPISFILMNEIWQIGECFKPKTNEWQFVCWSNISPEYISLDGR